MLTCACAKEKSPSSREVTLPSACIARTGGRCSQGVKHGVQPRGAAKGCSHGVQLKGCSRFKGCTPRLLDGECRAVARLPVEDE
eukprot:scaffold17683_cov69-Phaeocystis_antarctica.AAC.15